MFIKRAKARLIKNSRNESSIEVKIKTFKGTFVCSAPSGKSKGKNEVPDYNPLGARTSCRLSKLFLKRLEDKNLLIKKIRDLAQIEFALKEFEKKKGVLGGNAFYAIEGALLKAAAKEKNLPLWKFLKGKKEPSIPGLIGNSIGGGLHTRVRTKKPDFQEFLFLSRGGTVSKAVSKNIMAYYETKMRVRLREKKLKIKTNDENAIICSLSNQEVLEIMRDVAKRFDLDIGLDIAASSFYDEKRQFYDYKNKRFLRTAEEQVEYLSNLINEFEIKYVEDPFQEEDFLSFKQLMGYVEQTNKKTLIAGDDLTVTNLLRLKRAFRLGSINAIIVKPNQVGSLVEVDKIMDFCKQNKIVTIFSHRSGETMDDLLADYAVGFGADFIKTGVLGKERLIKLRRLIEIENNS